MHRLNVALVAGLLALASILGTEAAAAGGTRGTGGSFGIFRARARCKLRSNASSW